MKRFFSMLCTLCLMLFLIGCNLLLLDEKTAVLNGVGEYEEIVFYCTEGVQDFTKYGKYQYSSVTLADQDKLKRMENQSDLYELMGYVDNFEQWVECSHDQRLQSIYRFDHLIIDVGDYMYIENDPDYPAYGCYDIYFFDSESKILYYFHNNI